MPAALAQPALGFFANRSTERSAIPRCIAALQNHEKHTTPRKLIFCSVPAGGVSSAQMSVVPSLPSVTSAHARNTRNIQGAA